ncbi:GNAT family N-acetyltransferase [Streptomyces sp. LaBMicrA B280]|uniref:GNAT family N-acetyltransferase n=1 Tax=Streptomyces sp. LaBMicrA B280 TaxID=3391001 RepID=UPI003BA592F6
MAERPDLRGPVSALKDSWPEFMRHEPIGERFHIDAHLAYPEYVLVAVSAEEPGKVLARGYCVPIGLDDVPPKGLPDSGWDGAVRQAHLARLAGYKGDALCGLEVVVRPGLRGTGIGTQMLRAMHQLAETRGFRHYVAPVRPPGKAEVPDLPMSEYIQRTRNGLPQDPLLRAHVKLGADIVGVAPASMVVVGSLDNWREWTGLPFDTHGPTIVPEALTPVHCDLRHDMAAYVEPNVWVHRRL